MSPADPAEIPDLLHRVPLRRLDEAALKLSLGLAFAGSGSAGLFAEALEGAELPPSAWEPAAFSRDLFLQRFVTHGFRARIGGQSPVLTPGPLLRVLSQPPTDPAVVALRQGILAELVEVPALRAELEQLYLGLCKLRGLFEGASGARHWVAGRRQLEVLTTLKEVFDRLATAFVGARSELARLAAYGARVQGGEAYRALADLLSYDERLATVHLEVGIGADGHIRGFQVVSVTEHRDNPFANPPWKRWAARFELLLRGFRFSEGEVLARLVDAVFEGLEPELPALVQLFGDLEFYLGALGFRDQAVAAGLEVCLPTVVGPEQPRVLERLFNPLLLSAGTQPVPCDLTLPRHGTTVLVTGPNSGGKTRLLQSLGLTQLLCQAGAFVPARRASLSLAPALVLSLIEEARADQAEGRLGTELIRIRALFERLPPGAVVLLDELCSGTNPSEGEEIFELVVSMLGRLSPHAFITTHFLAFAARLERERHIPDLRFLQVELGPDRRATYQFVPGVAATSLAGQAAERLGVTGEQLLALVEQNLKRTAGAGGGPSGGAPAPVPPAPRERGSEEPAGERG